MKNFNTLGFHWKIQLLGGGEFRGRIVKKGGAWTVCRFKGELGKKEGVVFWEVVDTPMDTILTEDKS